MNMSKELKLRIAAVLCSIVVIGLPITAISFFSYTEKAEAKMAEHSLITRSFIDSWVPAVSIRLLNDARIEVRRTGTRTFNVQLTKQDTTMKVSIGSDATAATFLDGEAKTVTASPFAGGIVSFWIHVEQGTRKTSCIVVTPTLGEPSTGMMLLCDL